MHVLWKSISGLIPSHCQGLSSLLHPAPAGSDSDSDSELSLDEHSSSYASSHSSDSEDDGGDAEDKWNPAGGPVHSTPKGEQWRHSGLWTHLNCGLHPLGPIQQNNSHKGLDWNRKIRKLPTLSAGQTQEFGGFHRLSLWRATSSQHVAPSVGCSRVDHIPGSPTSRCGCSVSIFSVLWPC